MTAFVALLRAVNVGGNNPVPMAPLRAALEDRGLEDVSTILQSGNVVFRCGLSESAVAALVRDTIDAAFGLQIGVVVRSAREIAAIRRSNPFLAEEPDRTPTSLHVAFLAKRPSTAAAGKLDPDRSPPDALAVHGREVYLSYPNGLGRTRLTLDYLERTLGVTGTARNWKTVLRLAELLEA